MNDLCKNSDISKDITELFLHNTDKSVHKTLCSQYGYICTKNLINCSPDLSIFQIHQFPLITRSRKVQNMKSDGNNQNEP